MARHLTYRYGRSGLFRRRGRLGASWERFTFTVGGTTIGLAARSGWGYSVWAWSSKRGQFSAWQDCVCYKDMEAMKKKRKAEDSPLGVHAAPLESVVFGKLHSIVAHCAVTAYDDGDKRVPGWFSVKTIGSAWQVEVKDPDTLQMLRVVQATLDDALTLTALLLDSEDCPWEADIWAQQRAAQSKKKK